MSPGRTSQARLAHQTAALAIKSGELHRQPCEVCGETDLIEAHHDNYDKPLDVRWLCSRHHRQLHASRHRRKLHVSRHPRRPEFRLFDMQVFCSNGETLSIEELARREGISVSKLYGGFAPYLGYGSYGNPLAPCSYDARLSRQFVKSPTSAS